MTVNYLKDNTKQKILDFFKVIDKYYVLIILFLLFAVMFIIFHGNFYGLMLGLVFVLMVVEDVIKGVLTGGIKSELKELVVGLLVAVSIWYGISFLLNTSTPISAVVSCSMLPNLERGDMVLVRGDEFNTYGTLYLDDVSDIGPEAVVTIGNVSKVVNGSIDSFCMLNRDDPFCALYVTNPDKFVERHGQLEFHYGKCERRNIKDGDMFYVPCVVSVKKVDTAQEIKLYPHSDDGSIVVYQPNKGDLFSYVGDIVHRAVVKIKTKKGIYYLTKGDNNQITDLQVYYPGYGGNHLIPEDNIKGRIIFRIPIIGYVKLFLSAQLDMPEQCDYVFNE